MYIYRTADSSASPLFNERVQATLGNARTRIGEIQTLRKWITIFSLAIMLCLSIAASDSLAEKPKVLYVNSYHQGYKWSDDIEKGLLKALGVVIQTGGTLDTSRSRIDLKIFRMDTKLNTAESFKQQAALSAKSIIEDWQPDIVVTSDDNAAKYLIVPYFMGAKTPFVFCGVNWDASGYGFPAPNITGMIEVAPLIQTIELLKKYSRGDRIGFIGADSFSNRKTIPLHKQVLGVHYTDGKLVASIDAWKQEYIRLQDSVDILLWLNPIGISGWDRRQAENFILANTKIPTGCAGDNTVRYVLLGRTNIAEEQGWWSGKTALKILGGTPPADIPITQNKNSTLYLNISLAGRLGIKFSVGLIEKATLIEELSENR